MKKAPVSAFRMHAMFNRQHRKYDVPIFTSLRMDFAHSASHSRHGSWWHCSWPCPSSGRHVMARWAIAWIEPMQPVASHHRAGRHMQRRTGRNCGAANPDRQRRKWSWDNAIACVRLRMTLATAIWPISDFRPGLEVNSTCQAVFFGLLHTALRHNFLLFILERRLGLQGTRFKHEAFVNTGQLLGSLSRHVTRLQIDCGRFNLDALSRLAIAFFFFLDLSGCCTGTGSKPASSMIMSPLPSDCTVWSRNTFSSTVLNDSFCATANLCQRSAWYRKAWHFCDGSGSMSRGIAGQLVAGKCKSGNQHQAAKTIGEYSETTLRSRTVQNRNFFSPTLPSVDFRCFQ